MHVRKAEPAPENQFAGLSKLWLDSVAYYGPYFDFKTDPLTGTPL